MPLTEIVVGLWIVVLIVGVAFGALLLAIAYYRNQEADWDTAQNRLVKQAQKARQNVAAQAAAFEPEYPAPYDTHYQQAQQIRQTLTATLDTLLADPPPARALPITPLPAVWRVLPVIVELRARRAWHAALQRRTAQLGEVETGLAELAALQKTIAGLGQQTKQRLAQAHQTAQTLEQRLTTERRAAHTLQAEAARLAEAREALAVAGLQLPAADPPPAQVVRAYPHLQHAEAELQAVTQALTEVQTKREQAAFAIEAAQKELADVAQELADVAEGGQPAPQLSSEVQALRAQVAGLQPPLERGEYEGVLTRAQALLTAAHGLETRFNHLLELRAAARKQHTTAHEALAQAQQWAATLSAQGYVLDETQPRLNKWEGDLARAHQGLNAEAEDTLQQAQTTCRTIQEQVLGLNDLRQELKTRLPRAEDQRRKLREKLTPPNNQPALAERLETLATEVLAYPPAEWGQLDVNQVLVAARALPARWSALDTPTPKESQFETWFTALHELGDEVFRLERHLETLTQIRRRVLGHREQARKRLQDKEITGWLTTGEQLAEGAAAEVTQTLKAAQILHTKLLAACDDPEADLNHLERETDRLRQLLGPTVRQLQTQFAQLNTALATLEDRLRAAQTPLEKFARDPALDFPLAERCLADVLEWREYLPAARQRSLRALDEHRHAGEALLQSLADPLDEMRHNAEAFTADRQALSHAVREAMTQLETVLAMQEQHQPLWNSAAWADVEAGPLLERLHDADQRLRRLERPPVRLAFREAMHRLEDLRALTTHACAEAATLQNTWADRWTRLEDAKHQLERAIAQGQRLTGPQGAQWEIVHQQRILGWERQLRQTGSFREASTYLLQVYRIAIEALRQSGVPL